MTRAMGRIGLAAVLGLVVGAEGPASADMYTIDFNSVPLSSTPESYTFTSGPFTVTLRDVVTIGPGNPSYLGQVGIQATGGEYDIEVTSTAGHPYWIGVWGVGFGAVTSEYEDWDVVFQGAMRTGSPYPEMGYLGYYPGEVQYGGSSYGPTDPGYAGPSVNAIWIGYDPTGPAVLSDTQVDGIMIYAFVPEPSTALPTAIAGLMGLGYAWRRRKARAIA